MVISPRSTTLLLTVRHPPWHGRSAPVPTPSILIALERQRSLSPQVPLLLLWCILCSSTTGGRCDRSWKGMQSSRQVEELNKSCGALVLKQASSFWSRGKPTLPTVRILTHLLSLNKRPSAEARPSKPGFRD